MANIIRRREASEPISTIHRIDPFRMMRDVLRGDPFAAFESMLPAMTGMEHTFLPSLDVKETKDAYVFRADLPGVREEDLEVSLTGNQLTISGSREREEEREGERYHTYERNFGSFTRSFTLPEGTEADKVAAELKDGVLSITVPKAPHVQAKKVLIASKSKAAEPEAKPEGAETEAPKAAEAEVSKPKAA